MLTDLEHIVPNAPSYDAIIDLKKSTSLPGQDISFNRSIGEVVQQKLESINRQKWEFDQGNAFLVGDLGEIFRQHLRWKSLLPRIEPFFAIKCNSEPTVVELLASLGVGFDCASKEEIQQVLDTGVEANRIIYANPCKQASYIRYASQHNVSLMTFDNAEELYKIKQFYPKAECVLRILTDDSTSVIKLGLKFGAPLHTVPHLLKTAKELDLNVTGVSFHVGSGCLNVEAFGDAVIRARSVFDQATEMGFKFTLLDVGGGFPGAEVQDGITFEKIAAILGPTVDRLFPNDIRVIAEPGRYYVASAFVICTNIIGSRTLTMPVAEEEEKNNIDEQFMYYINDGMRGSFNRITFDWDEVFHPKVLMKDGEYTFGRDICEPEFESSIWGPTCDPFDFLSKSIRLPKLEAGDWLYYENMGAYSISTYSRFNGFKKSEVLYTNTFKSY